MPLPPHPLTKKKASRRPEVSFAASIAGCRTDCEVVEETGLCVREIIPLVESFADVGRLTNKLFGYFALVEGSLRTVETGIVPKFLPAPDIAAKVAEGAILPASNIALLYLAGLHPRVRTMCTELGFKAPPWTAGLAQDEIIVIPRPPAPHAAGTDAP